MKNITSLTLPLLFCILAAGCGDSSPPPAPPADSETKSASVAGPESTTSKNWKYILNNAARTADSYAAKRNPSAVFIRAEVEFLKQHGGEFEGRYLLKMVSKNNNDISFAMLLPLFDESASTELLNDEAELWRVVAAKFNGRPF